MTLFNFKQNAGPYVPTIFIFAIVYGMIISYFLIVARHTLWIAMKIHNCFIVLSPLKILKSILILGYIHAKNRQILDRCLQKHIQGSHEIGRLTWIFNPDYWLAKIFSFLISMNGFGRWLPHEFILKIKLNNWGDGSEIEYFTRLISPLDQLGQIAQISAADRSIFGVYHFGLRDSPNRKNKLFLIFSVLGDILDRDLLDNIILLH